MRSREELKRAAVARMRLAEDGWVNAVLPCFEALSEADAADATEPIADVAGLAGRLAAIAAAGQELAAAYDDAIAAGFQWRAILDESPPPPELRPGAHRPPAVRWALFDAAVEQMARTQRGNDFGALALATRAVAIAAGDVAGELAAV